MTKRSRGKPFPKRHGMFGTRIYGVWASMIDRCTNPRHKYWHHYGGRGITVCDEWRDFVSFWIDMGPRPEGLTLDRTDNNKGYDALNCRWATWSEQVSNRRTGWHHKRKRVGASSSHLGVSWRRRECKWLAYATINGKHTELGYFDDELLAARVAAEARSC